MAGWDDFPTVQPQATNDLIPLATPSGIKYVTQEQYDALLPQRGPLPVMDPNFVFGSKVPRPKTDAQGNITAYPPQTNAKDQVVGPNVYTPVHPQLEGAGVSGPIESAVDPALGVPRILVTPGQERILANVRQRESGNNYTETNPQSTASGAYQFVDGTWKELTAKAGFGTQYARAKDAPPEVQDAIARFAIKNYDPNSSYLWQASMPKGGYGQSLGNGKFMVSPNAIAYEQERPDTSVQYMSPAMYLALTPDVEDNATENAKGAALGKSLANGDSIYAIPTLDVKKQDGKLAVYDQDGRHRAQAAMEAGVDLIPVAIRGVPAGTPIPELKSMRGSEYKTDFTPVPKVKVDPSALARPGTPEALAAGRENRRLFGEGVANVGIEGLRLLENVLPEGVSRPLEHAAYTVGQRLGVLPQGEPSVHSVDEFQRQRLAEQQNEPDPLGVRTAGEVVGTLPTVAGGPITAGAVGGVLQPSTGTGGEYAGQKVEQAAGGALLGGVLKLAGSVLDRLLPEARTYITQPFSKTEAAARKEIETAFEQSAKGGGVTPAEVQNAMAAASAAGQPLTLTDIGGQPVKGLAKRVFNEPGPARQFIRNFVESRSAAFTGDNTATGSRIANTINNNLSTNTAKKTIADIVKVRRTAAQPLWQKAMQGPGLSELKNIIQGSYNTMSNAAMNAGRALKRASAALADAEAKGEKALGPWLRDVQEAQDALNRSVSARQDMLKLLRQAKADGTLTARGATWSPRLQEFLNTPEIKQGISRGIRLERQDAIAEGRGFNPRDYAIVGQEKDGTPIVGTVPNMKLLATAKEGLDARLADADMRNPITGVLTKDGRSLNNFRQAFVSELDRLNPEYKTARDVWAGDTANISAVDYGRKLFSNNLSPEQLRADIEKMSSSERDFVKVGAADTLRADIGNTSLSGDPSRAILNTPSKLEKLRAITTPQEFQNITEEVGREALMEQTNRMFPRSALGRGESLSDTLGAGANLMRAVSHAVHFDIPGMASSLLYAGRNFMRTSDPEVNLAIARLLFNPDISTHSGTTSLLGRIALPNTQKMLLRGEIMKRLGQSLPYIASGASTALSQ